MPLVDLPRELRDALRVGCKLVDADIPNSCGHFTREVLSGIDGGQELLDSCIAFKEYTDSPDARAAILTRFAKSLGGSEADFKDLFLVLTFGSTVKTWMKDHPSIGLKNNTSEMRFGCQYAVDMKKIKQFLFKHFPDKLKIVESWSKGASPEDALLYYMYGDKEFAAMTRVQNAACEVGKTVASYEYDGCPIDGAGSPEKFVAEVSVKSNVPLKHKPHVDSYAHAIAGLQKRYTEWYWHEKSIFKVRTFKRALAAGTRADQTFKNHLDFAIILASQLESKVFATMGSRDRVAKFDGNKGIWVMSHSKALHHVAAELLQDSFGPRFCEYKRTLKKTVTDFRVGSALDTLSNHNFLKAIREELLALRVEQDMPTLNAESTRKCFAFSNGKVWDFEQGCVVPARAIQGITFQSPLAYKECDTPERTLWDQTVELMMTHWKKATLH